MAVVGTIVLVIAGLACVYVFTDWDPEDWIISSKWGILVWTIGLPAAFVAAYYVGGQGRNVILTLLVLTIIFLVGVGNTAIQDADDYRNHNCWAVKGSEDKPGISYWTCAPGKSVPYQWYGLDESGGSMRECSYVDAYEDDNAPSGAEWRCEQDEW